MKIEVQDSVSLFKISGVLFLVMTRTERGCAMVFQQSVVYGIHGKMVVDVQVTKV